MENVTKTVCAIAGLASLWAVSAAMNWEFLPWGATGLAKLLIIVAFVGATSLILSFLSVRALLSRSLVLAICLLFLIFLIFPLSEIMYFRSIPDDHEMFRRQVHGTLLSTLLSLMSSPLLLWRRHLISYRLNRFLLLFCALLLSTLTIVLEFILFLLRGPASSTAYLAIDSSIFSVAVVSIVALIAIASFAWPHPKTRPPDVTL